MSAGAGKINSVTYYKYYSARKSNGDSCSGRDGGPDIPDAGPLVIGTN